MNLRSPVLDAGGKPQKKKAEASMDWKPNACTMPGPGIEPRFSGGQQWRRTTTLPAFSIMLTNGYVL